MSSDQVIVGITGAAGSGKDAAATAIESMGFTLVRLAGPLKDGLAAMLGVSREYLERRDVKEEPLPGLGVSPRVLQQTLGTEWGREMIHPDIWVRMALMRSEGKARVVVPDVRFDNEARAIRERGGIVIRVRRPGVQAVAAHSSEVGVSHDLIDRTIRNDGSLEELELEACAAVAPLITPATMDWPEEAAHASSGEGRREPAGDREGVQEPRGDGRDHLRGWRRVPGLGGVDR